MKNIQKNQEKKLSLEKFKIAEIKNKKVIIGGNAPEEGDPPATSPTVRG
ncbi:MAG: hypothetical protein ABIP27_09245 [Flavobacterium circumlabens]|uniref:Uncharacterized protein n=1 Tax=Flavobacterium circumlabens TaxID=2133765 RepID=A0ABY2AZ17_9FLAO|nr:hypothetical protein [Flavobacterium circumlabens]TCN57673.1 hypothetical protein EV142_104335 [Flavobacterium circumlabens]